MEASEIPGSQGERIRIARAADAAVVQSISAEAYIPSYATTVGVVPKPAQEDYRDRITRGEVWVLETNDGPCGVVVLERMLNHLMIYSVAVHPQYQGRGYGRLLLGFAEQHAASLWLPTVRLYTNRRMERNLLFYRSCGYREMGTRPHPTRLGEVVVDMMKPVLDAMACPHWVAGEVPHQP